VLATWFAGDLRGEIIRFARGGQVQLPAEVEGRIVRLDTPDGFLEFRLEELRRIAPGCSPEREWPARRDAALAGGSDTRFAAAWWALTNGLTPEAEQMLRTLHASDPAHQPTARMVATLDRLDQPCDDPPLEPIWRSLNAPADVARGAHVLLIHQLSPHDVAERIELLERVVKTFYLMFDAQAIDLEVPCRRLVSVWLARQEDYRAWLRSESGAAFQNTQGYYHPTLNAVIMFDTRTSNRQRAALGAIQARRQELSRRTSIGGEPGLFAYGPDAVTGDPLLRIIPSPLGKDRVSIVQRDLNRRQLLIDLERRTMDLGTAAHETVHQLVMNGGLAPRQDALPIWLHEGLAEQFEVIRGGRWAGVGRVHDIRLPDYRRIYPRPRLSPLIRDVGLSAGYRRDSYAAAWALVYYLRKAHSRQFLTFLDLLRSPRSEDVTATERVVDAFHRAFAGDFEHLETDWHRYMDTLRLPGEAKPER
jgi:hypothetical protein